MIKKQKKHQVMSSSGSDLLTKSGNKRKLTEKQKKNELKRQKLEKQEEMKKSKSEEK